MNVRSSRPRRREKVTPRPLVGCQWSEPPDKHGREIDADASDQLVIGRATVLDFEVQGAMKAADEFGVGLGAIGALVGHFDSRCQGCITAERANREGRPPWV